MAFWIFMLIMAVLCPLTMICFGSYFAKTAPKNINMIFGYRTVMSMKNKDTWKFAHNHCGKLWRIIGWITLAVSVIAMLFVLGKNIETTAIAGGIIVIVQVLILVASIIPTEIALNKNFDADGNRKIITK